jgi:hypothetical protein
MSALPHDGVEPDEEGRRIVEPTDAPPDGPPPETELVGTVERAGTLEVVHIDDLNVDYTYQRDLNSDLVNRIKDSYDMAVAGTIFVSRRANGSLWVVDGAHRVAGATLAGEKEMLAQVLTGLDRQTEAEMRLKGNVKRADKSAERFKAQVAAGHAESLAIMEIAANFETKINVNAPDAYHGINAISAVETLYRVNKGILLTRTFEMIRDAYGNVGGKTASVAMMKGVAWLITRHEKEMDRGRMIDKMARDGVDGIERRARSIKLSNGGALWVNFYRSMIDAYNERLPVSSKLEWKTSRANADFGGQAGDDK